MSLSSLARLLPPPEKPVETEPERWEEVEKLLGTKLPKDYRSFALRTAVEPSSRPRARGPRFTIPAPKDISNASVPSSRAGEDVPERSRRFSQTWWVVAYWTKRQSYHHLLRDERQAGSMADRRGKLRWREDGLRLNSDGILVPAIEGRRDAALAARLVPPRYSHFKSPPLYRQVAPRNLSRTSTSFTFATATKPISG